MASILLACAGHHHASRGSLSEAMEKASDRYEGERKIDSVEPPVFEETPENAGTNALKTDREEGQTPVTPPVSDEETYVLFVSGGPGLIKSDDYDATASLETGLGFYLAEKQRLELCAGLGWAGVAENSALGDAIDDDLVLASLGLRYKIFTTPRHTFMGHYFILGLNYTWMWWEYEHPIEVGDETIGGDYIRGLEFSAGMGLHIVQTRRFQVGVEAVPSVLLLESTTDEGFDNDVFDTPFMLKLRLTASWMPP